MATRKITSWNLTLSGGPKGGSSDGAAANMNVGIEGDGSVYLTFYESEQSALKANGFINTFAS